MGEVNKRLNIIRWLDKFHDGEKKIILLQETHASSKVEEIWKKEWKYRRIIFSLGTSGSKGVAIIFPKQMDYKIIDIKRSTNGRYVAVKVKIENQFCIINFYAPNCNRLKDQLEWLSEIQEIIQENSDANLIIGGDLNDCFIPHLDRYKCKPGTVETEYVKAWKTICSEFNLADIWRILNPDKRCYTWRQGGSLANLR
jgi:exonuclease III